MDIFEQALSGDIAEPVMEAPAPDSAPELEVPQPVAEPEAEPAVAAEPEAQPREENGRFAPISALQEERQKRQDLERRVEELTRERAAPPAAPTPAEAPQMPDPYDDPKGYAEFIGGQQRQDMLQMRFSMSREMANTQFGSEEVEAARNWAQAKAASDPAFDFTLGQQAHPFAWIVQQHKRDQLLSQINGDPDEFVRRRAVEMGYQLGVPAAPAAPVQPAPAPAAPRSIAHAPAAGGSPRDVPTGPTAALDATFK